MLRAEHLLKEAKELFIGVGLRSEHYPFFEKPIEENQHCLKWFEIISENYIDSYGRPRDILNLVRENNPISMHGVSLSIASHEGLNFDYLEKLKQLIKEVDPFLVSDHLCWTGSAHANLHNLLPFAYNEANLSMVSERIDQVQNSLGREMAIENLSAYFDYKESTFTEWDFIKELAKKSGCKLLLDINNIYVNSQNHDFDAKTYLDTIPLDQVAEIHLAGFSDMGDFLFDTHSKPVYPAVWDLFEHVIEKKSDIPVLIEWDEDIPDFRVLEDEAKKAIKIWEKFHG
jgi:uncharacterized protein (UPF0276 family)